MRLTVLLVMASVIAMVCAPAHSQSPTRHALLIGNKGYSSKIGPLRNPHNDVDLVGASLRELGFKTTVLKDATYKQLDSALKRYATEVQRAGRGALSFVYYSGHGVSNPENGINYLIPVDVPDADDDKIWFESFQQNVLIDLLSKQSPAATHYLVFDACRNELNLSGSNAKSIGQEKGFVPVSDTSGLLIAYATAPKRTASDVGDGSGPYARALAEELLRPGVEAVGMFRNVQIRVKQSIGQDPWLSFPSLPPVYLAGNGARPPAASTPAALAVAAPTPPSTPTALAQLPVPVQGAAACVDGTQAKYCVSSVLATSGPNTSHYGPRNLFDGDPTTAWVEGVAGTGTGEWLVLSWNTTRRLTGLRVVNGYGKDARIFGINGRLKRVRLSFSNGTSNEITFQDIMGPQDIVLAQPVQTRWLRIEILSVTAGSKYSDTALSEIAPRFE